MSFTPTSAVPKRLRGGAVSFVVLLLAVVTFASFGLPRSAGAPGTPPDGPPEGGHYARPEVGHDARPEVGHDARPEVGHDARLDGGHYARHEEGRYAIGLLDRALATVARATIDVLTRMVAALLGEWPVDLVQAAVRRGWPAVHRFHGTNHPPS
jgi:hypothetical protein